jgi:hypothetical protein
LDGRRDNLTKKKIHILEAMETSLIFLKNAVSDSKWQALRPCWADNFVVVCNGWLDQIDWPTLQGHRLENFPSQGPQPGFVADVPLGHYRVKLWKAIFEH